MPEILVAPFQATLGLDTFLLLCFGFILAYVRKSHVCLSPYAKLKIFSSLIIKFYIAYSQTNSGLNCALGSFHDL